MTWGFVPFDYIFVVCYFTVLSMYYDFDWSFDVGRWILLALVVCDVNENEWRACRGLHCSTTGW